MQEKCHPDLIVRARRIYASAVTRHKGKQKNPRMDKGLEKKKQLKSEATFLRQKRSSVQGAIAELKSNGSGPRASVEELPLSVKGLKELALQKRRRLNRSVEAADSGFLLPGDEGAAPFVQLARQKQKHLEQDRQRIEALAHRTMQRRNVCEAQLWNWRSLGPRTAWCDVAVATDALLPLLSVQVA